jgi:hypothetical protein
MFFQALASPTSGFFAGQTFNWRSNSNDNQRGVSGEEKDCSDFSLQTQTRPPTISSSSSSLFQSSSNSVVVVLFSTHHSQFYIQFYYHHHPCFNLLQTVL